MPVRIYTLAKELKIENKELVELCAKAGISGKGSALASLTDDEVAKVKALLDGGSKTASKPAASGAPQREAGAIKREQYIPPRKTDKIMVLDGAAKEPKEKGSDESKGPPAKEREQVIRLAEMPEVNSPPVEPKEPKQKVQKPDIALPKDAIAGAKKGKSAPLQQFTESHKKKSEKGKRPAASEAKPEAPLGHKTAKRRGKTGADAVSTGMGDLRRGRTEQRKTRSKRVNLDDEDTPRRHRRSRAASRKSERRNTAAPRKDRVILELPCTIRSFSEAAGVPAVQLCFTLASLLGVPPNTLSINSQIDDETAMLLAEELSLDLELKAQASLENAVIDALEEQQDDAENLQPRPPIVTFLGHVDHGKTSLLDRIIGIDVVSGEAGGITQHIRAYNIDKDGRSIAFVDTPGHEAFTEMRARGANVTDIAVLVVAADDGVMPQTEEAISHAKAAGVPIVVALNKMDLPGADENQAMQQLAAKELLPSAWGGDIEVVKTSATTGEGIDELLETLLVTAELHEYRANPERHAMGTCLEAEQEPGRGVIAKLMVQNGTLQVGDVVVCGSGYGRVKAMYNTLRSGRKVSRAGPSTPVNITGLDIAPEAGDRFYVLEDIGQAREIAEQRHSRSREQSLSGITTRVSFEEFQRRLEEGRLGDVQHEVATLNLIIRADVQGSIEAIQKELAKFEHPEVQIKTLQASVGGITAADVTLAYASEAIIAGFNVVPDEAARALADQYDVEIRRYDVIYKLTDDIKAMLAGKLQPEQREVELGHALVKQVFQINRTSVAGCHVTGGAIERGCRIRVSRDGRIIGTYPLESLRRHKDDAKEVARGLECGMKLAGFNDVKIGDVLEAYKIEEVARTL